jgi:2-polyprenyl-3-methyl-5-hydroxy-6-metoxy-1,4-benzoquinol methylase
MDLKESDILGESVHEHWYYKAKALACRKLLRNVSFSTILDIGAGSGFFSRDLLNNSSAKEAWCIDTSYLNDQDTLENSKSLHFRKTLPAVNADLILLMDVLEHIDDDRHFLDSWIARAPSGATFLISVPAFQSLWSAHDIFLEHKRRYTLHQIEKLATSSGLKTLRAHYFFAAVFPIAYATRVLQWLQHADRPAQSQLVVHHPLVNQFLLGLCRLELPLMRYNRLGGLTAFYLGIKS